MAADDGHNSGRGTPGDNAQSKGRSSFVPRWRKHTAESQPIETPPVDPAATGGIHPNLQPQSEPKSKKFQPRWRQHAVDLAAAKEIQQQAQQQSEQPVPQAQDKPGFQPRWRRTAAAPSPSPEAPLEPQPTPGAKGFQPKWRERSQRAPQEAPPPKAGFTPRWKRNLAETPPAPEGVEIAVVENPTRQTPTELEQQVVAEANPLVTESPLEVNTAATEVQSLAAPVLGLAAPVALALAPDPLPDLEPEVVELPTRETVVYAPTQPQGQSVEDTFLAGAAEEALAPVEAEPPSPPEKKRLPRPQAHSVPKAVALPMSEIKVSPAEEITGPAVPTPEGEDPFAFVDTRTEPGPAPGPEIRFLPSPEETTLPAVEESLSPVDPQPRPEARVPKRLDDEAMAALKATASLLTSAHRPPPPPPPPPPPATSSPPVVQAPAPPPPQPSAAPRYVPTPSSSPRRTSAPPPQKAKEKPVKPKRWWKREPNISTEEVSTFTRQFAVMVGAGLPIHQALNFFAESTTGPLGKVIDDVATKISSGFRLSNAMAQNPHVFSEVYLGLVELGESTSHIDEALEKLADLLEKQVRLAKRLQSALVYPAFLVAVSMAAVGVFLQYVLPTMIPLFQSFSLTLPLPTRMLLASRHLVWPCVILSILGAIFWGWFQPAWNQARRRKADWAYRVDRLTLKIPLFGKFIGQIAIARVLFALATMIETGLPIMNALKRCESVASNLEFATRLEKAGAELRDGATVTDALALYEVLPSSCLHLLSAGEESAQMAEMVQYAARFYEEEVDHSIDQFMSLVEPIIMCVMGIVVGFIVLSAVLPTVEMINHLGG